MLEGHYTRRISSGCCGNSWSFQGFRRHKREKNGAGPFECTWFVGMFHRLMYSASEKKTCTFFLSPARLFSYFYALNHYDQRCSIRKKGRLIQRGLFSPCVFGLQFAAACDIRKCRCEKRGLFVHRWLLLMCRWSVAATRRSGPFEIYVSFLFVFAFLNFRPARLLN